MNSVGEFQYSTRNLLGHGAFALVFKGSRTKDKLAVAVKQIRLKNVPGRLSSITQKEIEILKDLRHPNIVQLFDYLETQADVFLIMEYCNGGDMGDYIRAMKTLSEDSIRHLARCIAGALQVLQAHQIIHRDIKPQNLLLSYPFNSGSKKTRLFRDATVKLADFGFARYLASTDMAATLCGSPLYMAPEILLGRRYDYKVDLWSVGTILFECVAGEAPFSAENPHGLRKKYARENLIPKIPSGTSNSLSQLLLTMIKKDPKERISYESFFDHVFLKDGVLESGVSQHTKSSPVPIKRHSQHPGTRQSPQRRGSSLDMYSLSPSSASGPPLSHQVGSVGSVAYLSAQSPRSDITDQGFILVDLPASSGSGRYHRSASYSSTSPGSTAHTPSLHTPSSHGSLTRYNSLTTPFYQARPALPESSTPTNINVSSGYHSRPQAGSMGSLSRSNSGRKSVPFGQLIQPQALYSQSPHRGSITSSPSPQITPPTQAPNQARGLKYAHPVPGSGSRLSSLVEESDKTGPAPRRKSVCDISPSCLLVSDEGSLAEDESFPLGLNMSLNSSQSEEQEQDSKPTEYPQNRRTSSFNQRLSQDLAAISSEETSDNKIGSFQLPFLFEPQDSGPVIDCPSLNALKDSLLLGKELVAMAKARQGPIMLLSTSTNLSDSGVGSKVQRCSEQLVLYAKAVSILESGLVVYELNMASSTIEPSSTHRQVESDVRDLLAVCLDRARNTKDQLTDYTKHMHHVSAEKLLYLEGLDMCKSAVLNEKSTGETKECIKRYRRAKLIFQYLLTTATSRRDKILLQKYVTSSENRVAILTEQLSSY